MKIRPISGTSYLPTLDGWRAVAIGIVVLSHDSLHAFGGFSTAWIRANGRVGVDIFFALSGVLICSRLLSEEQRNGRISMRDFYMRRVFRIQPAAWTYLLVLSLLMYAGVLDRGFPGVLSAFALVRCYWPLTLMPRDWYTAHFWSLAVEEHFYFLFPMFLVMFRQRRVRILLAVAGVMLCWTVLQRHYPGLQFGWNADQHSDVAMNGIVIACAFAVLLRRTAVRLWCERWLNPYGTIALLVFLLVLRSAGDRALLNFLLLCVYPLALISTVMRPRSLPGRLLESRPMRTLGRLSYSMYIWHMLFFADPRVGPALHSTTLVAIRDSAPLRYLVVLGISVASYSLIERPLVRLGHRLSLRHAVAREIEAHSTALAASPLPYERDAAA